MMSKIVISFAFTMLCAGLQVDIKNMCPRSDKFCIKVELNAGQSYELNRNETFTHDKVTFSGSHLFSLPGNFFYVFPDVKILSMTRCSVASLDESDFMGAENLKRLELWKNHVEVLPVDLFSCARNLEWLDLSSNRIREMQPSSFLGLRKLKKLFLFRNRIRILPPAVFRDLVALETIHLEDNYIETLNEEVFQTNVRLGIVRIRNNRIKELHPGAFISMRNLYWLDLSYNFFDEIQAGTLDTLYINNGQVKKCLINGKIRNLFANDNQIRTLFIQDLGRTQEIHIRNNKFYDLTCISAARNLVKLDASQNPLRVINSLDFHYMPDLIFLNMSGTNIRDLGPNTFANQANLVVLDLSHNDLTEITSEVLSPLRNLRELYLDFNRMEQLNYSNLRDRLPALRELGLAANNWKCSYLRDIVEYMDRNGISLSNSIYNDSFGSTHNVAGIKCSLL